MYCERLIIKWIIMIKMIQIRKITKNFNEYKNIVKLKFINCTKHKNGFIKSTLDTINIPKMKKMKINERSSVKHVPNDRPSFIKQHKNPPFLYKDHLLIMVNIDHFCSMPHTL